MLAKIVTKCVETTNGLVMNFILLNWFQRERERESEGTESRDEAEM